MTGIAIVLDCTKVFGQIESFLMISTINISSTDAQCSSVQQWEGCAPPSLHQLVSYRGASDECGQIGRQALLRLSLYKCFNEL
jgi:hypothetical protein